LAQPDDNKNIRPRPDPTVLTTAQLDREVAHLKELMDRDKASQQEALEVALTQMDRRLDELNNLRKAVEEDRMEFVRVDVYHPAHEELRRQRQVDGERMVAMMGDIKTNSNVIARLESSMMWLSRLVIAALIGGVVAYAFQRLLR
jgi:hypothetical protein